MKEQAVQMQALINLRETAIVLVLGRRARDVLNLPPDGAPVAGQPALDGVALAAALKAAVNGFVDADVAIHCRQLDALTDARNRRVHDYLHNTSRAVVNWLVCERIGTLIIGHDPDWKQGICLGRRTNQSFVSIPFACLIQMLTYKAELVGITVLTHDEAYTSKCSFFDGEPVGKRSTYAGKRIQRYL